MQKLSRGKSAKLRKFSQRGMEEKKWGKGWYHEAKGRKCFKTGWIGL